MCKVTIIATFSKPPTEEQLKSLLGKADWVELRGDLFEPNFEFVRANFPGKILYTLRSVVEGGKSSLSLFDRSEKLIEASKKADFVDLEGLRDLTSRVIASIPPEKRIISWHGGGDIEDMHRNLERFRSAKALFYKFVLFPSTGINVVDPLLLLIDEDNVVAFSAHKTGSWTRFASIIFGSNYLYVSPYLCENEWGQFSVYDLDKTFPLDLLLKAQKFAGIVGKKVESSISPLMYNSLFKTFEIPSFYLPFVVDHFGEFWLHVIENEELLENNFEINRLTITSPWKFAASSVIEESENFEIAAYNSLKKESRWIGINTDVDGVTEPLTRRGIDLKGIKAAVLGAGGAAYAVIIGLLRLGCKPLIFNRSANKASKLAKFFGLNYYPLEDFSPDTFDLVVNATAAGFDKNELIDFKRMREGSIFIDLNYLPSCETRVVQEARRYNIVVVDGREFFVYQARSQMKFFYGLDLEVEQIKAIVGW